MNHATPRSLLILLAVVVATACGPSAALAGDDDEPLVPEGSVRKPAADKPEPQVRKVDQPANAAADEELVESLSAKAADKAVADRLERVIDGMRDAQRRLTGGASGGARAVQDQVAKDLAALIDELQDQSQNSSENSPQGQAGQKKSPRGGRGAARQRMAAAQQQMQRQSAAAAQAEAEAELQKRRQEGKSKDTSELTDRQAAEQAEQERRRQAVQDFWGHLPPNVREQLLNINTEKFLPKYEDLVRRYYESLAEKSKKGVPSR